jgi:hypothetical protein
MKELAEEEQRRLEAEFQRLVREARDREEDNATKRAEVRVTLPMMLLRYFAALGPAEVTSWALTNSIVLFGGEEVGYDLGSVLQQVFSAVLLQFPEMVSSAAPAGGGGGSHYPPGGGVGGYSYPPGGDRPLSKGSARGESSTTAAHNNISSNSNSYDQQQQGGGNYNPQYPHPGGNNNPQQQPPKCVQVRCWDVVTPHAHPPRESYPAAWGQKAQCAGGHGAVLVVEKADTELRLVLTKILQEEKTGTVTVAVTSPVTQTNTAEVTFPIRTAISVILEAEPSPDTGLPQSITPASGITIKPTGFRQVATTSEQHGDGGTSTDWQRDFKFKFKDAVVTIAPPAPSPDKGLQPTPAAAPVEEDSAPASPHPDLSFDDSFGEEEEEEMEPNVVHVTFVEPDFNPQASLIQRVYVFCSILLPSFLVCDVLCLSPIHVLLPACIL